MFNFAQLFKKNEFLLREQFPIPGKEFLPR